MPEKCRVINCNTQSIAKGLCDKHYRRLLAHGDVNAERPDDWGKREKHPAYRTWCGLRRYHLSEIPVKWKEDFWKFVADVPQKPEKSKAFRPNKFENWSSSNFYWKECRSLSKDKKLYHRDWHKKSRDANFEYYKNKDLQKNYGVSYKWYKQTLEKQNNVCAICECVETAKIRGKSLSLAVDHCHDTGKVRGLLCRACNTAIGSFKHDLSVLEKAILYLSSEKHSLP
jgi:hypothetical protein